MATLALRELVMLGPDDKNVPDLDYSAVRSLDLSGRSESDVLAALRKEFLCEHATEETAHRIRAWLDAHNLANWRLGMDDFARGNLVLARDEDIKEASKRFPGGWPGQWL